MEQPKSVVFGLVEGYSAEALFVRFEAFQKPHFEEVVGAEVAVGLVAAFFGKSFLVGSVISVGFGDVAYCHDLVSPFEISLVGPFSLLGKDKGLLNTLNPFFQQHISILLYFMQDFELNFAQNLVEKELLFMDSEDLS